MSFILKEINIKDFQDKYRYLIYLKILKLKWVRFSKTKAAFTRFSNMGLNELKDYSVVSLNVLSCFRHCWFSNVCFSRLRKLFLKLSVTYRDVKVLICKGIKAFNFFLCLNPLKPKALNKYSFFLGNQSFA